MRQRKKKKEAVAKKKEIAERIVKRIAKLIAKDPDYIEYFSDELSRNTNLLDSDPDFAD